MALVNERIKELRLSHGYTLSYIAGLLGVTEATAQRYESGKGIKTISYSALEKYANIFHCTPQYLMGWDEDAITAAEAQQSEVQNISDMLESENMDLYNDLFDLMLTREELMDVLQYANFVKSRRKES